MEKMISQLSDQVRNLEIEDKYLTFLTDNQLFGVSISQIMQIVGMQEITPIPEFPKYMKGIINLRGNIIPVMDMRLRLNRDEISYNERTCIIVANIQEKFVGLIVDEVDEVRNISQENVSLPPKVKSNENNFVSGVAKLENKIALILDLLKILNFDEINDIVTNKYNK
ncbi:MAG: chemotaxis protein CheW [Oscillospiraceae bacterium]